MAEFSCEKCREFANKARCAQHQMRKIPCISAVEESQPTIANKITIDTATFAEVKNITTCL